MVPSSWLKFSLPSHRMIACATDDTKLWFSLSVKQCQNPCSTVDATCVLGFEYVP